MLTAATLIRTAPAAISDAYVATRLDRDRGQITGALSGIDHVSVLNRLSPSLG